MRKRIALVISVLIFAFLPNIIPSRLLLTPDMALKMIHKSNESGLGDPKARSTAYLLMLYAAAAAVIAWQCLRFIPKNRPSPSHC
ncbi:TPA: hypothetical protein I9786_001246 [Serratia marcescens]|nr:hypothetical protein [Serratia marcescens]HAT5030862.1 hypothetical protein [Serratia marcescens]